MIPFHANGRGSKLIKKSIVRLDSSEREQPEQLVKVGKVAAYKRPHAQILLKAGIVPEGQGWGDREISEAFGVSTRTVGRVRQRLVEGGLEAALSRAKQARYRMPAWMATAKPIWSRWPVQKRRKGTPAGHCGCWQTRWWNWRWWKPFPTKPCAKF